MASTACGEGPKGFSLESSLMSWERRSSAAGDTLGISAVPMPRAGLEIKSKKRLIPTAHSCHGRLRPCHGLIARGTQPIHFLRGQWTKFSWRNIECKRSVTYPLELLHMMSDLLEHAPNLAVASLDQRHFIPRICRLFNQLDTRRGGPDPPPIFGSDGNSAAQLIQRSEERRV